MKLKLFILSFLCVNWAYSKDTIPPVITLNPGINGCIEVDCYNSPYVDAGAKAFDNNDGDITSKLIYYSNVNTRRVGQYTVTYIVFDSVGNSDTAIRNVCIDNTKGTPGFKIYNKGDEFLFAADHQITRVRFKFKWILDGDTLQEFNQEIMANATLTDKQKHTICYLENQCNDTTFTICKDFSDTISDRHWIIIKSYRDLNNNCIKDNSDEILFGSNLIVDANNQYTKGMQALGGIYSYFFIDTNRLYKIRNWDSNRDTFSLACLMHDTIIQPRNYKDSILKLNIAFNCIKHINDFIGGYAGVYSRAYPNESTDMFVWMSNFNYYSYKTCETVDSGLVKVTISGPAQLKSVKSSNVRIEKLNSKYAEVFYSNLNQGQISFNNIYGMYVEPSAKMGDTIFVDAEIVSYGLESDYSNNKRRSYIIVKSSYDPNNKLVDKKYVDIGFKGRLEYTINFQNTGNAEAKNILIIDTLSMKLDTGSLRFISSSHTYHYKLEDKVLKMYFDNINLPDSHSNQIQSHGFITFSIQLRDTLKHFESIENTGHIYFDFNPPIITNTVQTVAMKENERVSLVDNHLNSVSVYPNPMKEVLYINDPDMVVRSIQITDLIGREIYQSSNQADFSAIHLNQIPSGVYILILKSTNHEQHIKLLK